MQVDYAFQKKQICEVNSAAEKCDVKVSLLLARCEVRCIKLGINRKFERVDHNSFVSILPS